MRDALNALIENFVRQIEAAIVDYIRGAVDVAFLGGGVLPGARGRTRSVGRARKSAPSPARRLQGQYIGRLRKLRGPARARVQATARKKGVAAAVALADRLLGD